MTTQLDFVIAHLIKVTKDTASLDSFKKQLDKDPLYALQWSDSLAESETRKATARWVTVTVDELSNRGMDDDEILKTIRKMLTDEILRAVRFVPSSSSQGTDMVENYRRASLAYVLELLG